MTYKNLCERIINYSVITVFTPDIKLLNFFYTADLR